MVRCAWLSKTKLLLDKEPANTNGKLGRLFNIPQNTDLKTDLSDNSYICLQICPLMELVENICRLHADHEGRSDQKVLNNAATIERESLRTSVMYLHISLLCSNPLLQMLLERTSLITFHDCWPGENS